MDPSSDSVEMKKQFFELLKDDKIRKLYNKTLDFGRKHMKKLVKIDFLKNCIENKVVPNTFRISNQPTFRKQTLHEKWTSAAKAASLASIRITVKEEENLAKDSFNVYKESLKYFGSFAPENLKKFIAEVFEKKNYSLMKNMINEKVTKMNNLKIKFGIKNNSDSDQKTKKARKFTKKSVWTRRQRKFRNKGVSLYFN